VIRDEKAGDFKRVQLISKRLIRHYTKVKHKSMKNCWPAKKNYTIQNYHIIVAESLFPIKTMLNPRDMCFISSSMLLGLLERLIIKQDVP